jgi:uncharacterized protein YjbJ (UPF0337 family)
MDQKHPHGAREPRTGPSGRTKTEAPFTFRDEAFRPLNRSQEIDMNKDQVKGRVKEAVGKIEQEAGKATGSLKHQAKGLGKEAAGKIQKNVGDAREEVKRQDDAQHRDS